MSQTKFQRLKQKVDDLEQEINIKRMKRMDEKRESLNRLTLKQKAMDRAQKLLDGAEKRQTEAEGRCGEVLRGVTTKHLQLQQVEKHFEGQRKLLEEARQNKVMIDIHTHMLERQEREVLSCSTIAEGKKVLVEKRRKAEEDMLSEIENEKKQVKLELKKLAEQDYEEAKSQEKKMPRKKRACAKQQQTSQTDTDTEG